MTFYAAVVLYAAVRVASYCIKRRQGFHGAMPVGSVLLAAWAVYLLGAAHAG